MATLLGEDTASGEPVVIKTTTAAVSPPGGWMQFEHEADILAHLPDSAAARVLHWEHDSAAGSVLIRPYVAGVSLADRLRTGPLSIADIIAIAIGVVRGLEAAHLHGVLHRDIKPANIIVHEHGAVLRGVLVDFVVSRPGVLDEDVLDQPLAAATYLSPEQAGLFERGVDARSDLYAVGLVIFEAVTRRRPFEAEHIGDLLRQHLCAEPPSLTALRADTPRALDGIVQHLLRKEPRDRYQSAAAVASDLEELARALARGEADPAIVAGTHDQRATLSEPAFVGRTADAATLAGAMARARGGFGGLVLVEARSGGGKTWLLEELVRRSARDTTWVLRGRGVDHAPLGPLQVLDGVLRELAAAARGDPAFAARLLHDLDEDARAALAGLPPLAELFAAPLRDVGPEIHGEARLLPALAALLDALATAERPALILLDDFQWADELSTKLVALWQKRRIHRGGGSHTLIVVAFRSEEVDDAHALRLIPVETHLELAPFGRDALRSASESMAGPLPDDVVTLVGDLSEGIPFMVSAVLHGLVEGGALVATSSGWRLERDALPAARSGSHAAVLLVHRLERFPANALRLLTVGAVLGKSFDLERATALAELSPREALQAVSLGKERQIVWLEARGQRCVFVHDKLREALLGRLAPPALRALHGAAGRWLETHEPDDVFKLAYHFDAAGEPQRGLPHALEAAEQARAQLSLGLAEAQYRIAERGAADADLATRLRLLDGLGDVLMLRGSYGEAQTHLAAAASLARDGLARAELEGKIGELSFKRGDVRAASDAIERALRSLGRAVPRSHLGRLACLAFEVLVQVAHTLLPRLFVARRGLAHAAGDLLACRLYSRLAYAYWFYRGKVACLWSHLREMNLAERYASTAELAQAYSEHAPVMTMLPWFARGIRYAARSLAIRRARGDVWGQGQTLNFYGVVLYAAARFDECIERCRESMHLLSRAGDRWEENTATWNLALALYRKGELGAAVKLARTVHRAAKELGDRQAAGIALGIWARASSGRLPGALIDAALLAPTEDVHAASEVALAQALRLLRASRLEDAIAVLAEADRRVTERGLKQEYVAPLVPWLATAQRLRFEATPPLEHVRRAARLDAAWRTARRAERLARQYPNNLPHALRDLGLLAAARGRAGAARRFLDESVATARAQGARHELARSLEARGAAGVALGWLRAASDTADGTRLRLALEQHDKATPMVLRADSGTMRPITVALADRFATLLDSGRRIATALTADAIFTQLVDAAQALLRGEGAAVLRVDGDGAVVVAEPHAGLAGLARRAILGGVAVLGSEDELVLSGARSAVAVPVVARGQVAACLCVVHARIEGLFGDDDKRLAQFLATLAGAALENAQGYADLADLNVKLAVAGRMATVGTLASGVAHEINNPLTYVLSNLWFLDEELTARRPIDDAGRDALHAAVIDATQGAERVRAIVRDLRAFARDDDERVAVDVRKPLEMAIAMAKNEIHHRATLVCDLGDVLPVLANEGRLGQVFLNILINAAQATPEGNAGGNMLRVSTSMVAGQVVVTVRDSGAGIPPEIAERVFEPFFTTKPVGQGTGLGLSICHGIVTALGGTIRLESSPGRGTTVRIALPTTMSLLPAPIVGGHLAAAAAYGKVVVIDDDLLVGRAMARLLEPAEATVETDGQAGIERVILEADDLDLVLCDVMMPALTGREIYDELRRRRPGSEAKVVFVTGGAFTALAQEFLRSVPNPCLQKPLDGSLLRALLAERVAQRKRI